MTSSINNEMGIARICQDIAFDMNRDRMEAVNTKTVDAILASDASVQRAFERMFGGRTVEGLPAPLRTKVLFEVARRLGFFIKGREIREETDA